MSVQSEINRIRGNVTAALEAIAAKGVSVGNGSNSDDLATLIAAIEAGGGSAQVATGTYTVAADTELYSAVKITHNAGFVPTAYFFWCIDQTKKLISVGGERPRISTYDTVGYMLNTFGGGSSTVDSRNMEGSAVPTDKTFSLRSSVPSHMLYAGYVYQWAVVKY